MPQAQHEQDFRSPDHTFHRSHVAVGSGSSGHWIKMAGILAPLVIGELVQDPNQKWRLIRLSAVATALVSEGMWQHRLSRQREERREREPERA